EEQPQVVDAVAQHGQALEARAEGEADVALRIEAVIAHYRGMYLPRAGELEPAPLERALRELQVDLRGGLGEGEVGRPEAHLQLVRLEEASQEIDVDALQIREADVLVDPQPLDLVEHRRMGGVRV